MHSLIIKQCWCVQLIKHFTRIVFVCKKIRKLMDLIKQQGAKYIPNTIGAEDVSLLPMTVCQTKAL